MADYFDWTREAENALISYWEDGWPTVTIARAMGCSKNAVIGKAHRLGVKLRPSPLSTPPKRPGRGTRLATR